MFASPIVSRFSTNLCKKYRNVEYNRTTSSNQSQALKKRKIVCAKNLFQSSRSSVAFYITKSNVVLDTNQNTTKSIPSIKGDVRTMMRHAVASKRAHGDFSPAIVLKDLVKTYLALQSSNDSVGLYNFFVDMATELGVSQSETLEPTERYLACLQAKRDENTILSSQDALRRSLLPSYERLFELILSQPNGMKVLVDMRQSVLTTLKKCAFDIKAARNSTSSQINLLQTNQARIKALESSLRDVLQHWFSVGFLNLERITWESPASLLEKIFKYSDSVHPMPDWAQLKTRLQYGKRCFGFFHPSMPLEPLVFIEVALTNQISNKIAPIVTGTDIIPEESATTAIFYAITSTQPGLAGIDLGHMLIERVVHELQSEFPNLRTFSTFSPVPSFKTWLDAKIALSIDPEAKSFESSKLSLNESEANAVLDAHSSLQLQTSPSPLHAFQDLLNEPNWEVNSKLVSALEVPLMRLCAHYIAKERKRELAIDPVANFHLRNGAQFYRVCWMADTSAKRMKQSYGIMVNYLYDLDKLSGNNEAYLTQSKIATSSLIDELL